MLYLPNLFKLILLLSVAFTFHGAQAGQSNENSENDILTGLGYNSIVRKIQNTGRVNVNNQVDELFANIRLLVAEEGLDPIIFPSSSDTFTVSLFGLTLNGLVEVSNIRIGGLSALHRTGDCIFNPLPTGVIVDFGSNDILFGLDITYGAGIFRTSLKIELLVRHVSLMIDARIGASGISLQDFRLNEIGAVEFDIKGIPMGSEPLSNLLNVLSNSVKDSLLYAFQEALRPIIESIINTPPAIKFFEAFK